MYKNISIVLVLIIIALVAYYNFYTIEPKIGVIDMERLLNESSRADELQKELEERGKELEQNYEGDTDKPEEVESQIYMEFAQNKQEIESELNDEIQTVLDEINQNNKYSVILYKNKVYQGGEDITEKVISKLDQKFNEVDQNE
jgi:Skp family chaperone for outer membrane proteins